MYDFWLFGAIFAAWFILNRWVLPLCGIRTCMTGGCGPPHHAPTPAARADDGSSASAPAGRAPHDAVQ